MHFNNAKEWLLAWKKTPQNKPVKTNSKKKKNKTKLDTVIRQVYPHQVFAPI